MIAIDTNVLLRLFILDDEPQCRAARQLVAEHGRQGVLLTRLTIAECVRVCRRKLGKSRAETIELVERLLEAPEFVIEGEAEIETALTVYRTTGTDFSDCLIAATAIAAGASSLFTFDRRAAKRVPGAVLLAT